MPRDEINGLGDKMNNLKPRGRIRVELVIKRLLGSGSKDVGSVTENKNVCLK